MRESFAGIARGKVLNITVLKVRCRWADWVSLQPYVTELDLKLASIPAQTIAFLKTAMPEVDPASVVMEQDGMNGETDQGRFFAYDGFLDDAFSV